MTDTLWSKAIEGDNAALNQLLQDMFPSVLIIAGSILKSKEFLNLALDIDDMSQEGLIALDRAVHNYCPEKGILFRTYAKTVVRNAITDYVRRIQNERNTFGIIISPEEAVSEDDPEGSNFEEIILNEQAKTPEQICIEKESLQEIHAALNRISSREREYLCYRYGFDGEYHDRSETAYHFYLSNSRAKRLEESALDNFRLELPWWY